jgi:hypothetical protein
MSSNFWQRCAATRLSEGWTPSDLKIFEVVRY